MEKTRCFATNKNLFWLIAISLGKGNSVIYIGHWKMNIQASQFNITKSGQDAPAFQLGEEWPFPMQEDWVGESAYVGPFA